MLAASSLGADSTQNAGAVHSVGNAHPQTARHEHADSLHSLHACCLHSTLPCCPRLLQLREAEDASAAAAAKAEELSAALEASEEALSEARSLTARQASRLSHLESEFEALQVRR